MHHPVSASIITWPFPGCLSSLIGTLIIGFRAHGDNPGRGHPKILNPITSAKTAKCLLPNKVHSQVPGLWTSLRGDEETTSPAGAALSQRVGASGSLRFTESLWAQRGCCRARLSVFCSEAGGCTWGSAVRPFGETQNHKSRECPQSARRCFQNRVLRRVTVLPLCVFQVWGRPRGPVTFPS